MNAMTAIEQRDWRNAERYDSTDVIGDPVYIAAEMRTQYLHRLDQRDGRDRVWYRISRLCHGTSLGGGV
jgi:hypothetical protein